MTSPAIRPRWSGSGWTCWLVSGWGTILIHVWYLGDEFAGKVALVWVLLVAATATATAAVTGYLSRPRHG
jgi:hypothetical protein